MKRRKLVVSKGQLELASLFPDSPMLLIGRSPACDMVLRLAGIQSVHFLLEWAGEGDFDPDAGIWVLTEMEKAPQLSERLAADSKASRGVVIGSQSVSLGGLTWKWSLDSLSRGELPKGMLRKQVQSAAKAVSRDLLGEACLEVIRLSPDGQAVVDVEHLIRGGIGSSKILPLEPGLKVRWGKDMPSLDWGELKATAINASREHLTGKIKILGAADLIFIEGRKSSYYFRLVPRLAFKESPYELFSDPFYKFAGVCLLIAAIFLFFVRGIETPPPIPESEVKPRIATVEIKQAEVKPVEIPPPAPPEPKVEIPPPPPPPPLVKPEVLKQAHKPRAPKIKAAEKIKVADKVKVTEKIKTPPVEKPPPPVEVKNMGLLGSMKKANPANSAVVNAETIVNRANDTATGPDVGAKILVAQAAGIVDMKKTVRTKNPEGGRDVLAEASSDVSAKDDFVAGALTGGAKRFAGAAFSIDASESEGNEASAMESGFGESVHGGLNRGQVGHAVFTQRQKIRACYQTALIVNPKLNGRVVLKWQISAAGKVDSIQMASSDLNLPSFETCIMAVLRATQFPTNPKKEPTRVLYPFVFKRSQ
ncbi:MAG: AgmX/PglI C-terminal domain-containing protein [Bdellovibrionales bacterium]